MNNQPLLTVIIPMYGVEKFIAKCLDSVTMQSYSNLEILCVNDGTKDRSAEIAEEYAKKDERVHVINNPQNMGLFRARVEGLKVAKGEYIAFVDADDYIGIDWYRLLIKKITEEKADMVIGNEVSVDENGRYYYHNNYKSFTKSHDTLVGDRVLDAFYEQGGGCYAWHVVWDKVYSAELMRKCMPYLLKIDYHLIMCEDIAFSSVFYTHARKLCFADADCYYYYRHSGASTAAPTTKEKLIKNITDVGNVFKFVASSLKSYDESKYSKHKDHIEQLKARYQRIWRNSVVSSQMDKEEDVLDAMEAAFGERNGEESRPFDFWFYDITSDKSLRYEWMKHLIFINKDTSVISFDIFDTLIKRPFYTPSDLFIILGGKIKKEYPFINEASFPKMRMEAEQLARSNSKYEDITLTEVYKTLANLYELDEAAAAKLKSYEEEAELKYCTARETAKELFDLALVSGKRVIITSDMYLEKPFVEKLLEKNGYVGYSDLFLSSDAKALKATGSLYRHVINTLKVNPSEILHIGDNWGADILKAQEAGMQAYFMPKATDAFENIFGDIYTGNGAYPFKNKYGAVSDSTVFMSQLPARCALAVMANNAFDNPFTVFQPKSNFNGDSYYMGYYGLGMHVLGLAEWMYRKALDEGYSKIVFLARDGKLIKEAFDVLCKVKGSDIKTEYFYATRKSLMPFSIKAAEDFYNIDAYVGVQYHTPRSILKMFEQILLPLDENAEKKYAARKVELDSKIHGNAEFRSFVKALIEISFSEELLKSNFDKASYAFKSIFDEHTATFDMGYSGRLQSIICDLAGCSVDTFFMFTNGYNTSIHSQDRFRVHSYYDFTPTIQSIVREFFMSDPSPSCYGYEIDGKKITPLLEAYTESNSEDCTYAVKQMQKAALTYCKDYWSIFGDMGDDFIARRSDYAIAFDHFLITATEFDRFVFRSSMVDDEVFSGYTVSGMEAIWAYHISRTQIGEYTPPPILTVEEYLNSLNCGKLKKAMTYLLFDRKTLKDKFKEKFKNHKIFLAICGFLYSIPRGIYRLFKKNK